MANTLHDLFMELAARYAGFNSAIERGCSFTAVLSEIPRLVPPAYPHRASASGERALSPRTSRRLEPTHVSDGVVTLGLVQGPLQLEASTFHGMEPDENRWNFDGGRPELLFIPAYGFSVEQLLRSVFNWPHQPPRSA